MMRIDPSECGYSLVELVVALLLLGMIALAAASGLHFGAQVWTRSQDRISSSHQIATTRGVLRNLFSHALPNQKGDYVTFDGGPDTVRFDVVPPLAFQSHGTGRASLSIERSGASEKLVIAMESTVESSSKREATLLEGGHGLRFAYLDASEGKGTWLAYWRDRSRLPDAVRLSSQDSVSWPSLVVRPAISQSASCALDPVSMTCRKI